MLCRTEYALEDGNIEYNQKELHNPGHLYTLYAVVNGEAPSIVYMLMQALDINAYKVLQTCLKVAIIERFVFIGGPCEHSNLDLQLQGNADHCNNKHV